MPYYLHTSCFIIFNFVFFLALSAQSQVVPDSSLENNNSIVIPNQVIKNTFSDVVIGGSSRGSTLFHSFQQFNIENNQGVYFSNPEGITNILSRVTGSSPSTILGKLGVLGDANLFLINPNGIIFGAGAVLDLNGSFIASTADSIKLSDGSEFSAKKPQSVPLLIVSVPLGLNFTGNSGSIEVQGTGHNLSISDGSIQGAGTSVTGLRVQPGQNIGLVGGEIVFDGGIVTSPDGKIEISSIGVGQVKINPQTENWIFDYSSVQSFQNIEVTDLSLLDASGINGGTISIQGNQIALLNSSYVFIQSLNSKFAGNININALKSFSVIGNVSNQDISIPTPTVINRTAVVTQGFWGKGADINISTQDLLLQFAGGVVTNSFISGSGGNIEISASNSVQLIGASPVDPLENFSVLAATAAGSSNSGNITLSTNKLLVEGGGSILSETFGQGNSGNIYINSPQSVVVKGSRDFATSASILNLDVSGSVPSAISSSTYAEGSAGNLSINTAQLYVLDGASVSSSTVASGAAGNIFIIAPELVKISGFITIRGLGPQSIYPSLISSSGITLDPLAQSLLGLPKIPTGNAGSISVTTENLVIDEKAQLTVRNDGIGNAGTLKTDASFIELDNQAGITASTQSGQGGNIEINSSDLLVMRRNSQISTSAGNVQAGGDGGQININASFVVAPSLENSDITANAFEGRGGNIEIAAQGIFGIESRPRLTPLSDITASSALGINGTVQINTLDTNPTNGLVSLPPTVVDNSRLVTQDCSAREDSLAREKSEFIITGRGGLPPQPSEPLRAEAIATAESGEENRSANVTVTRPISSTPTQIVEAQGWVINERGQVILTAQPVSATLTSSRSTQVTCYAP